MQTKRGFTLLEVLIALFIFTIVSLLLVTALRAVMDAALGAERKAVVLREMQIALLIFSQDVEQTVNRSVLSSSGAEMPAFIGSATSFTFTHTGYANPDASLRYSNFLRTRYDVHDGALWRTTWTALDQAPKTTFSQRALLNGVTGVHFQYLTRDGNFRDTWPIPEKDKEPLPRAVRVLLMMGGQGNLQQLYIIPVQTNEEKAPHVPPKS